MKNIIDQEVVFNKLEFIILRSIFCRGRQNGN